jgi:hypothetical protein
MIGTNALERARTREIERICEQGVMASIGAIFQNTSPFFAGRLKQSADTAENARGRLGQFLAVLDAREQRVFIERYQAELAKAYQPFADNTVLLSFPRLFIVATR